MTRESGHAILFQLLEYVTDNRFILYFALFLHYSGYRIIYPAVICAEKPPYVFGKANYNTYSVLGRQNLFPFHRVG